MIDKFLYGLLMHEVDMLKYIESSYKEDYSKSPDEISFQKLFRFCMDNLENVDRFLPNRYVFNLTTIKSVHGFAVELNHALTDDGCLCFGYSKVHGPVMQLCLHEEFDSVCKERLKDWPKCDNIDPSYEMKDWAVDDFIAIAIEFQEMQKKTLRQCNEAIKTILDKKTRYCFMI